MTRTGGIMSDGRPKHQLPDAKKHQTVSFIKSAIRIVGYILIPVDLISAMLVLVVSEVVGIFEELV
tara:strand:- start:31 stop:228 length:198 start_codon:yes stop_codon:yes gene_type:complete